MVYKGKAEDLKKDALFMDMESYYKKFYPVPDMFEMGPLYAQLFEPYRYLFIADYGGIGIESYVDGEVYEINHITDFMLNPANFLLVQDPDDPNDPVVRYWTDLGADPNLFCMYPDSVISAILDRDFVVDINLPIFADPNLRINAMALVIRHSASSIREP